jgi:hypothetical protein
MMTQEQVRADLMAAYQRRKDDGFSTLLLRCIVDPVKPLSETKRRRFHPLLVVCAVVILVCVATTLILSR